MSKHHNHQNTQPTTPTQMESYFFQYTYANPPAINGVAAPESYIGQGFAPVGTYHMGETIPVLDSATGLKQIGTYTIGKVDDTVKFNSQQLNHLTISEYDWGTRHFTQGTGLGSGSGGVNGLGSESGFVIGLGLEGSNAHFNNQYTAIHQYHF